MSHSIRNASHTSVIGSTRFARALLIGSSVAVLALSLPVLAQQPPLTPEELKKQQLQKQQQGAPQKPAQPPGQATPGARTQQPPVQAKPSQPPPPPKTAIGQPPPPLPPKTTGAPPKPFVTPNVPPPVNRATLPPGQTAAPTKAIAPKSGAPGSGAPSTGVPTVKSTVPPPPKGALGSTPGATTGPAVKPGVAGTPAVKAATPGAAVVPGVAKTPVVKPGAPGVVGAPVVKPGTPGVVGAPVVKPGTPSVVGAPVIKPGAPGVVGAPVVKPGAPGVVGAPIVKPGTPPAAGSAGTPAAKTGTVLGAPVGATPALKPGVPAAIGTPVVGKVVTAPTGPTNLAAIQAARVTKTDAAGRKTVTEPGSRTIIRQNNTVIVHRNETNVISNYYPSARSVPRPNGITETFYVRADGVRIVSEVDRNGRLIRRYGRPPSGPEIVYVDNRNFYRNAAIGIGIGVVALAIAAPVIAMPRERYIVEYDRATDDDIYTTLIAPPVVRLQRPYSLEEIRYSQPLRDHMPRIDLDTITFDTGSFVVTQDQYPKLERVARAMAKAIQRNPGEMFLIEGHTDAVGISEDNVSLSDRRAEAIQRVLFEYFQIPMENLSTQGYGEQYLKVPTQGPERTNRRVAVRRITPLLGGKEQG